MAFDFKNGFNKFADMNNSLNRSINNAIGKDVFKDLKKIEDAREFQDYSTFPEYSVPEPEEWTAQSGEEKDFSIQGNVIHVTSELDLCMKYRDKFIECANYYTDRFKYKYDMCATDFDAFLNYFKPMYLEGLTPMLKRAYSLFLPLGIFDSDIETFTNLHLERYSRAYESFATIAGIELQNNINAAQAGNAVGNSITMRGGGFGFKGAMKGVAQAELFNLGMGALGKLVEHQSKMSQEEKAAAWEKFNKEAFFEEVLSDYTNTFFTLIQCLSEHSLIGDVTVIMSKETQTIFTNLQNPMFPEDKFIPTAVKIISTNPFVEPFYNVLEKKLGSTDEINAVKTYFVR